VDEVARNPFEIFGLTPALVGELSEKELFAVLKTMYRSLLKTFHPDTVGKRKEKANARAVELNLAFEALDLEKNQGSFRKYRKDYLLTHPAAAHRNALLLQDKLYSQLAKEERLAEGFWSFLAQGAGSETSVYREGDEGPPGLSARNVLLGLQDVAIKNNVRHASWLLGSNYKNIEINSQGELWIRAVGRKEFYRSHNTFLLGCVPKEALDVTMLLERCPPSRIFKSPAVFDFNPYALPQVSVLNLISQDNFKKNLLTHLHPLLLERSYLFSLNRPEYRSTGLIRLEGIIIKMDPLPGSYSSDLKRMEDEDLGRSQKEGLAPDEDQVGKEDRARREI
jgi:hypothetical protein